MTHRQAHVPEFGNWDSNDQVPFTVVFDNVRAGKGGGKIFNPNDPDENPAAFGLNVSESDEVDTAVQVPTKQQPAAEAGSGLPARRQSGDGQGYARPVSADGSRRGPAGGNVEDSPNNQMYQGRLGNRPGSPYWERRNPSEGGTAFAPANPGKSRLRSGSNETPDRGAALPKFGAWDENDPSAGEGFTVIFNQARNEKKTGGPVRIPAHQGESPATVNYGDGYKQLQSSQYQGRKSSFWSCCLGSSTTD